MIHGNMRTKKNYQQPYIQTIALELPQMLSLSGGGTTKMSVNSIDNEVDASEALSKKRDGWENF